MRSSRPMAKSSLLALLFLAGLGGGLLVAQTNTKRAIVNSKHDFRASSTAAIRAVSENDLCVFCHTPHNADPGPELWNHKLSPTQFSVYRSTTLEADVAPMRPEDTSKLCLSCHDGTIALGDTQSKGLVPFLQGSAYTLPPTSPANLAAQRGFTDDHPFAFVPVPGSEIRNPPAADAVHLDRTGRLHCTSCHEPHREYIDPTVGRFLVRTNQASAICLTCHQKAGWANSSHRLPPDPVADQRYGPPQGAHTGYAGVSQNACESCHRPHAPRVEQRLVKFLEENTCYACHDGSVAQASRNIRGEFLGKLYKHPVMATPSVHDAAESPSSATSPLPETSSAAPRHAECADCHNAHFANGRAAQPPAAAGAIEGTRGHSATGAFLPQSANEFEICFKCHADSANKPQLFDASGVGIGFGRNPQRQFDAGNPNRFHTRLEFGFSLSYHPVTRPQNLSTGPGGEVPSLRTAPITPGGAPLPNRTLTASSYIYCTDCHNNDTGRNLGTLGGPTGPHGSNLPHLLERENVLEPPPPVPGEHSSGVNYSPANYALCNKCHDLENSILRDESFKKHREHIRNVEAACSTCHDPHASSAPMLINFDRAIVAPSKSGRLEYRRTGFRQGECYLTCHGKNHDPKSYERD